MFVFIQDKPFRSSVCIGKTIIISVYFQRKKACILQEDLLVFAIYPFIHSTEFFVVDKMNF